MTFLNGVLAFGAGAFALPLLIHLLNRSRFRTIPWGAMHLLETVIRVNKRRIRIEQLLLLLVRCAIPVLLAFCLARMVLTGWKALPGDVPSSAAVLLDNSYSMDAAGGERPHFAEAVDHVCDLLEALNRGSEVSVLTTGGGPMPVSDRPVFDPKSMIRQVRLLSGGYGAAEVAESLEAGTSAVSSMTHARRGLIVISDFQRSDWEAVPKASLERIRRQFDAMPLRPTITLLNVGREVEENVAVESLEFSRKTLGVGQDLEVRAHLRNYGPKIYQGARVLFRVDGTQHSVSQITLGAQRTAQVLFTHRFKTPGSHVVEVEVAVDDRLDTDNRYAAAVPVLEQIEVLLVDGAPSPEPLESETDFLAVALTPYTFGRVRLSDLIATQTVSTGELTEETVSGQRVVVLANVPKLSDAQVDLLTQYVRGGGSLLLFVGNKIDVPWHNRTLFSGAGLLPMRIEALHGGLDEEKKPARIVAQHFDHPALEVFNDRANGNLADAEIRKWYRLGHADGEEGPEPADPSPADERAEPLVLARLETGDPLIVERRFGDGLVVQVATACDADWSNLPMRPVYLPLVQQLVTTMASRVTPPRNIRVGEPVVAVFSGDCHGMPLSLTAPDGTRHTVRPVARGTRSVVRFGQTQRPGVYTLIGPDGRSLHFVAETSREESDLRLLDSERLESLADDLGADLVGSGTEYVELDRTRRHGREVWRL
ncbi:MAG: BatA domain-containing protein, partial [Planctomycetota bacterium]